MKIAICDDSEEIRLEIAELIKEQCPEAAIYHFSSGEGIIGSPNEYDIIFLDIAMGGISGLEAAEILRERQEKSGGRKRLSLSYQASGQRKTCPRSGACSERSKLCRKYRMYRDKILRETAKAFSSRYLLHREQQQKDRLSYQKRNLRGLWKNGGA